MLIKRKHPSCDRMTFDGTKKRDTPVGVSLYKELVISSLL